MILKPLNSLNEFRTALRLASTFQQGNWEQDFRQDIRSLAQTAKFSLSRQIVIKGWMATEETLEPLIPNCEKWLTQLCKNKFWTKQDQSLVNLILSCLSITNNDSILSSFYAEILSRNTKYLERNPAFLDKLQKSCLSNEYLTNTLHHNNKIIGDNIQKTCSFFERTRSISETIKSNSNIKSIAIVGNAPSLLKNEFGELIDDADIVIRFNNVVINKNNDINTGHKTDIWMFNPGYKLSKSQIRPSNTIWLSSYYPFLRPNNYWQSINDCTFTQHHYSDHKHWYKLVNQLNAPPSAGLLCISTLADTMCKLSVYGFSGIPRESVSNNNNLSDSNNHYGDSSKKSSRHNWRAESLLLNQLRDRVIFY